MLRATLKYRRWIALAFLPALMTLSAATDLTATEGLSDLGGGPRAAFCTYATPISPVAAFGKHSQQQSLHGLLAAFDRPAPLPRERESFPFRFLDHLDFYRCADRTVIVIRAPPACQS
ncbi:MAG: hypothetical protein ACOWWM_11025 [Desulfobacterales bacterium]